MAGVSHSVTQVGVVVRVTELDVAVATTVVGVVVGALYSVTVNVVASVPEFTWPQICSAPTVCAAAAPEYSAYAPMAEVPRIWTVDRDAQPVLPASVVNSTV